MRLLTEAKQALALAQLGQPAAAPTPRTTYKMTLLLALVAREGGTVTKSHFGEVKRQAGYKARGGGGFLMGEVPVMKHASDGSWSITPWGRDVLNASAAYWIHHDKAARERAHENRALLKALAEGGTAPGV